MTSRRQVLGLLALAPLAARAQPKKLYRIGVLETASLRLNAENFDRFRQGLQERGYVEGPTLVVLYRSAEGDAERFQGLAQDLVRQKVDLIVTRGTPATLAAKLATGTIPIVMTAMADPVESRVAASLAKPGANVTGLTTASAELLPRRLELLKALAPRMTRVAAYAGNPRDFEMAARAAGLEPLQLEVRSTERLEPAFGDAVRQGAQGVLVGIETLTQSNRKEVIELAAKYRLPAMYSAREFVDDGGLVSYGVSYPDLYYRAAGYVDRIFKGAAPGELAIERPAKFAFAINRATARALNIVIPPDLLLRADWAIG